MTVPSTPRKAGPFSGDGVATTFPFTYKVFAPGDVAVTIANAQGVETELVLNADYSVTLNPNQETSPGGFVTYPLSGSPLPTGSKLSITGDLDYDQPLDLPSGGNFSPLALENQLDRMVMQIQQLREVLNRTLRAPVTSNVDSALPSPDSNALIGWNSAETGLQNFPLSQIATALAFATYRHQTFTGDGVTDTFPLAVDPVTLGNTDVSLDGLVLTPGVDYTLVAGSIVTTVPPGVGAELLVRYGEALPTTAVASIDASFPGYQWIGSTNVEDALKEIVDDLAGANGAALVANATIRVDDIAALRALPTPTRRTVVYVEGYYTPGDGGGGAFVWVPASIQADNGGTVIQPDSLPVNGRWERDLEVADVRKFGARGNLLDSDQLAFERAIASGLPVYVPGTAEGGGYRLTAKLSRTSGPSFVMFGDGHAVSRLVWDGAGGLEYINGDLTGSVYGVFPHVQINGLSLITKGAAGGTAIYVRIFPNAEPGFTLDDVFITGYDNNTDYWNIGVHLYNVVGSRFGNLWISGLQETILADKGVFIQQDSGVGAMVHFFQNPVIKWCNIGIHVITLGNLGIEGIVVDNPLIIGSNVGIWADADSATYIPPYLSVLGGQIDVGAGATAGDQAIWTRSYAQVFIDNCVLYGHSVESGSSLVELDRASDVFITNTFFVDFATPSNKTALFIKNASGRIKTANLHFDNLASAYNIDSTAGALIDVGPGNTYSNVNTRVGGSGVSKATYYPRGKAGVANVASGARVNFGCTFETAPSVQLTHNGTSTSVSSSASSVDETGFTLNHSNGATITSFYWTATEIQ